MQNAFLIERFQENGFAIIPNVLSGHFLDELTAELASVSGAASDGGSYAVRHLAQMAPSVCRLAASKEITALGDMVFGQKGFLVRSLFFDKTPETNWNVAWHQDVTISVRQRLEINGFSGWSIKEGVDHVQAPAQVLEQMLTVRLHLDDCGPDNGPLCVIPGSHLAGRLERSQISEWQKRQSALPCHVPRGGALLMRPLLLHASSSATHPSHRRVIHLEFATEALPGGLSWLEDP